MASAATVNVQIGATFASTFRSTFASAESQMGKLGATVRDLDGKLQRSKGFQAQRQAAIDAEGAWRSADQELRSMGQHLAGLNSVSDKQIADFKALEKSTERMRLAMEKAKSETNRMEAELRQSGQSTKSLVSDQKVLERQLQLTANKMQAMARFSGAGVGKAMDNVGAKFKSLATQAAVAGAGLGYFFKTQFVDVASEFERFKTILETTEGSAAGADKAMKWVSDFAAKTPFELAEVTEAFVKLRAYGLDPTTGLLQTLGDTGAAMGKPVMQAVEAIADAVTGENERLKEFGIKGSKSGGKVTYEYTDKAGKQQTKTVDANNRKMIESTLTAIWSDKYGGAMDKLSRTWVGMVSNLKDQWARFTNTAMNAGLFDWMKGKLSGLMDTLNTMAANGELQKWAEVTGTKLKEFAEGAWALGSAIAATTKKIADFVGGWENLGIILVALKFAPLIFSVGQLAVAMGTATTSLLMFATGTATAGAAWMAMGAKIVAGLGMIGSAFKVLAAFMLTNPIGIAITLLSVAGYMLWKNWDGIKGGLLAVWEAISAAGVSAFNWLRDRIGEVMDWIGSKIDWIFNKLTTAKQMYVDLFSGDFGKAFESAKSFYGFGDSKPAATPAPATTAPTAPVSPVPAARTAPVVQQTNNPSYNISVQTGASDPNAVAKAIRAEMERKERERQANNRAAMADNLGN
jgi:hypothetical protein